MAVLRVFKVFEKEVIPKESRYKWTDRKIKERELKPSWEDLTQERIAVPDHLLTKVLRYLEQKHFVILVGNKDTGKTWLSYIVGYNLVEKQGKEVFYAKVDNNFKADNAWTEIVEKEIISKGGPLRYIILDDCHTNPEESESFFQRILDEGILDEPEQNLRFLFTMRKTGKFLLENVEEEDTFYNEGRKRESIVWLLPDEASKEHVKNIIKKFIEVKEISYEVSERELDEVVEKWGNDLYWVWLRLISWNYSKGQRLSDITDNQVCESIWSHRGEIRLSSPERRKILFPLSVLCQFEPLKVYELANFLEDNREMLNELINEGIVNLSSWRRYDFVSVPENFAELILKTMLQKDISFKENAILKQIQIFKDYLKSKPPNWYTVFYALYLARESEKSDLAKEILISLWNDTDIWKIVKENVKNLPVGRRLFLIIDSLLWSEGKSSWKESLKATEIISCYLKHNYRSMQNKLRFSSATTIRKYLPFLSRIVDLNKFFDDFTPDDYKRIINQSTIGTIRWLLFYGFQKRKLYSAAKKMVEALPDADLSRLISQENTSLYRLGGLIGNVMQVDCSAAKRFVEKLSEIDLSELFSRKDPIAEKKGYTKVETINFFLSNWLKFAPNARKRIVDNIRDDVWLELFQLASVKEGLYLLWHIYIHDSVKAKRFVKNRIGNLLLQKYVKEGKETLFLPLLGILHLCDFVIRNMPLETDITGIKQMLAKFKEEKRPTLLVLSLVALKVKLSPQQFKNIKEEILNEQLVKFIQSAPDLQVREVLSNLMKNL